MCTALPTAAPLLPQHCPAPKSPTEYNSLASAPVTGQPSWLHHSIASSMPLGATSSQKGGPVPSTSWTHTLYLQGSRKQPAAALQPPQPCLQGDSLLLGTRAQGVGQGAPCLVTCTPRTKLSCWQGTSGMGNHGGTDPCSGYRPVTLSASLPNDVPPRGTGLDSPSTPFTGWVGIPCGCKEPLFLSQEGQAKLQHF